VPKLSVDQALLKAKSHVRKGEAAEAQKLYQAVLETFPKNERARKGLEGLNKPQQLATFKGPAQDTINQLVNLYNQGQLSAALKQATVLTKQYPKDFMLWNVLGATNKGLGRNDEASEAFKKVTLLNPSYADGFNNLGVTLQDQGKLGEALAAYNEAISIKPDYAEAFNNIGNALKDQGQLEGAIEAYNKALAIKPDYADAYNNMSSTLKDQGKLDEAMEASQKALSLKPDYAPAYNNMGNVLKEQGKMDEAIKAYNKALALKPDYAPAHNNMGVTLQEQGKLEEAIETFSKALTLNPDYAQAYNNMGNVLKDQGKHDEAIGAFNKALALKPHYTDVYNNIGNVLKNQGKLNEAIEAFKRALSLKPDHAEVYNNMGVVLQEQGELDKSIEAYEIALSIKADHASAHRNLSSLIKYKSGSIQIDIVKALLQRNDLRKEDICQLHYAMAKMREDLGDFQTAFKNYVLGGALRKKLLSYDLEKDKLVFDQVKNTALNIREFPFNILSRKKTNAPIFILGMARSGTTLVEQIISCHPKVQAAGELPFLKRFGEKLSVGNLPINSINLDKLRNSYFNELEKISENKLFITDKMPNNFLQIGLILKALPEAKIIHVTRDPAATCWSNFKHYFSAKSLGYSYNLNDTVSYFKMYQELMNFWNELYGDQIYHLDYDRLTAQQTFETKNIIKYLELEWDNACLSPHKNKRSVRTASQQQVREKVYKGSSLAWRKFEPYLNGILDELLT
jgi:tetratricopeptide (TPR) repeat protein